MKKKMNITVTENDATTFKSTESKVLDLFSMGGSLRTRTPEEIEKMVSLALAEDKLLAIKCLFYIRDCRGGAGERRTFREGLKVLSRYYPEDAIKLLDMGLIERFGRWDDIFYLDENVDISRKLSNQLALDVNSDRPSLLCKWLPSENAGKKSRDLARKIRKSLNYNSKKYRKILTALRAKIDIIESQISRNKWKTVDYSKITSKNSLKYKKAFIKHDKERYEKFLESVEKGEAKINTKTLFPYEIVREAKKENNKTLDLLWNNLPDYTNGNDRALVVADVSGSMTIDIKGMSPIDISISLAIYFAERNKGIFKNKFITFSGNPHLQEITGSTLNQKIKNLENAEWEMNTNVQAVFELILNTAINNSVPKKELPGTIYIISDMEFDSCIDGAGFPSSNGTVEKTNYERIRERYTECGYEMPLLVFWNVSSHQNNVPVTQNQPGVILVSGASPTIFKMVMKKDSPYEFMLSVLNSQRYDIKL